MLCNLNLLACWTALACVHSAFGSLAITHVYPRIIESRSSEGYLVLMINEHISLNLQKASPFAANFRLFHEKGGREYVEERSAGSLNAELYKDSANHAAILISRTDGLRLKGVIKGNMLIDHAEDAVVKDGVVKHRLSIRKQFARADYHGDALRYNMKTNEPFNSGLHKSDEDRISERSFQYSGSKHVTVRTSVIIGHRYFKLFKVSKYSAINDVIEYLAVFFTLVNIIFEKFTKSVLDLQLAVVKIVLMKASKEPFLREVQGRENVMHENTINMLNQFVALRRQIFDEKDIVVYLSNYSIFTSHGPDAAGYATLGGACTPNRSCLVKDNPKTFEGVYTVAHEALHLLGVVHEGEDAPHYLKKSPGARRCSHMVSSVMAAVKHGNGELSLSSCTQDQVMAYLESDRGKCLLSHVPRHSRKMNKESIKLVLVNTTQLCKEMVPKEPGVSFLEMSSALPDIRDTQDSPYHDIDWTAGFLNTIEEIVRDELVPLKQLARPSGLRDHSYAVQVPVLACPDCHDSISQRHRMRLSRQPRHSESKTRPSLSHSFLTVSALLLAFTPTVHHEDRPRPTVLRIL
ncbi:venom metalloproteinase antarease TserMP_A-like [Amblyomma americanum]